MKKAFTLLLALTMLLTGCSLRITEEEAPPAQTQEKSAYLIAATTAPIAQFARALTQGTDIEVICLVNEPVSCLHDYALSTAQMAHVEQADLVLLSGLGLEDAMADALSAAKKTVELSAGVKVFGADPHYWLDPERAEEMAEKICTQLLQLSPENTGVFLRNQEQLEHRFDRLEDYREHELERLKNRKLVTFHDGFSYLADFLELRILASMETEAGSEPTAAALRRIAELVKTNAISAVFTEVNGSDDAAQIIAAETGCAVFALDMALSGDYFAAMEKNIDTILEALA